MRTASALLCLTLLVASCGDDDDSDESAATIPAGDTVSGVVTVAEDAPELPEDATLTVVIEDIGLADAPAEVVAQQEIDVADDEFPIEFGIDYDPAVIVASNPYQVSARVESGDELLLISDTVVPVITDGAPTDGVEVELIVVAP
jgi:putative lipoprotein